MAKKAGVDTVEASNALVSLLDAQEVVPILLNELKSLREESWLKDVLSKLDPDKLTKAG